VRRRADRGTWRFGSSSQTSAVESLGQSHYGARLACARHVVILIARGQRAAQLRARGAVAESALSGVGPRAA